MYYNIIIHALITQIYPFVILLILTKYANIVTRKGFKHPFQLTNG
jgi:hypothetical protein